MSTSELNDLGLTEKGADACSCCAPGHDETARVGEAPARDAGQGVETDYFVEGMTCSHCVRSVTEEVSAIAGVSGVDVDLVAGGVSQVRIVSTAPVDADKVREAIEEAGYTLAPRA